MWKRVLVLVMSVLMVQGEALLHFRRRKTQWNPSALLPCCRESRNWRSELPPSKQHG